MSILLGDIHTELLFVTFLPEKVTKYFAPRILCVILQPDMELNTFIKTLAKHPALDRSAAALQATNARLHWKGMVGSAKSLLSLMVAQQVPGTHLFILSDKEEAAYFLNDFEELFPDDKRILFYPASYRVPYQQEQTDNANVVARAEVLEKLSDKKIHGLLPTPRRFLRKYRRRKI